MRRLALAIDDVDGDAARATTVDSNWKLQLLCQCGNARFSAGIAPKLRVVAAVEREKFTEKPLGAAKKTETAAAFQRARLRR